MFSFPNGGGRKIRHNFDGIIISKYLINEWVKVIYSLLKIKKKFQKLNIIYKNIIPVHHGGMFFFTVFYKNWKKVLNFNEEYFICCCASR